MNLIATALAKMKLRRLCLKKKAMISKMKKQAKDIDYRSVEIEKAERNLKRVKRESHNYEMNRALDRLD